jgi:hypothetical protein
MDGYAVLYLCVAVLGALVIGLSVSVGLLLRALDAKDDLIDALRGSNNELQQSIVTLSREEDERLLHMGV